MACTPQATVPPPTLGGGLSLGVTLPSASFDPTLCCKVLPFAAFVPPVPLGLPLDPATAQAINTAIATMIGEIQTFLDQLQVRCPLE